MTVQNTIVKNIYKGNGSTTVFPYTFPLISTEHIKCYVTDSLGTTSETLNFTIGDGSITYPKDGSVLADGEKITIARELPLQQLMNLLNQGSFYAEDIEKSLDELVMMIQQLQEQITRTLKVSISEDTDTLSFVLPRAANKSWRWDENANSIVLMDNPESVLAENKEVLEQGIAAMNQAMTSASDAAANAERAQIQADYANESKKAANQSAIDAVEAAQKAAGYVSNVTVWNGTTEYNPPDVVMTSDGSTYRCIKANVGTNPQNHPDYWVITTSVEARTFEFDLDGNLTPRLLPITSHMWEVAGNDEIMPIGMDDVQGDAYKLADNADIDLMMKEEQHEIS